MTVRFTTPVTKRTANGAKTVERLAASSTPAKLEGPALPG